jgi:hypothetical protein
MVLLCNAPQAAPELLSGLASAAMDQRRAEAMRGARLQGGLEALRTNPRFTLAQGELGRFVSALA